WAGAAAAAPSLVRHMSLQSDAARGTLTLALTSAVDARAFRLQHPQRLIVDLPQTRRAARLPAVPHGGVVAGLRASERREGRGQELRLVIALRGAVGYRLRWRRGRTPQLYVELSSAGRSTASSSSASRSSAGRSTAGRSTADRRAAGIAVGRMVSSRLGVAQAPAGERAVIVAIDPGHGGMDPGATGPDGTHEKDVTLAIGRALAARIDRTPGMRAVLTRDGDYFVPLLGRIERAQAAHADLFVSIHADSVRDPAISGASVYILSERGASSAAARELAEEENAADLRGGIPLSAQAPALRSVLLDLSQNASIGQSGEAAQDVLDALDAVGDVRKREVQRAAFVVLKSPFVPSMLVETAYISNPADERRLRNPRQQQLLAEAIFRGIAAYFRQYPPQGSLFARSAARTAADPRS
ncbi:MAG TPA: N-acetylmuramoyl-L-alanine amidase, partial [Steroidobacteraceae bacterium]|nr:N-acetylmuramoyl-L-alanine amidase [Steroidobacteraceae bacterium]